MTFPVPTYPDGTTIRDDEWNAHVDALNNLNTRLGPGITTTATADARFGSGVGTGSNVITGSASAQLGDLRSRATAVENRATTLETNAVGSVRVRAVLTADQTGVASATFTKVSWPSAVRVYSQGITWVSNTDFQVNKAGLYEAVTSMRFGPSGTGADRAVWIGPSADASTGRFAWDVKPPGNGTEWPMRGKTDTLQLTTGTSYSVWVYQDAGAALDLKSFGGACSFSLTYFAPSI